MILRAWIHTLWLLARVERFLKSSSHILWWLFAFLSLRTRVPPGLEGSPPLPLGGQPALLHRGQHLTVATASWTVNHTLKKGLAHLPEASDLG